MGKRWANSIVEVNYKLMQCDYCGRDIKPKVWFKIRPSNGNIYVFDDKLCEHIWDKKHGVEKPRER